MIIIQYPEYMAMASFDFAHAVPLASLLAAGIITAHAVLSNWSSALARKDLENLLNMVDE